MSSSQELIEQDNISIFDVDLIAISSAFYAFKIKTSFHNLHRSSSTCAGADALLGIYYA